MKFRWLFVMGIALSTALCGSATAAQDSDANTEKVLATGLGPLTKIEICPPIFEGNFGTDPRIPAQSVLMESVQSTLKNAGIVFSLQTKHRETFIDRTVMKDRKTTGWMHIRVQVLSLSDKKAYAFRVVVEVQSPVTHPGDPKSYVFANLYQETKLTISAPELTSDAIKNATAEVFGRFCDRWASAHAARGRS